MPRCRPENGGLTERLGCGWGKDLRSRGRSLTKPGEPGWGSQESLSSPSLSLQVLVNNYFGHGSWNSGWGREISFS